MGRISGLQKTTEDLSLMVNGGGAGSGSFGNAQKDLRFHLQLLKKELMQHTEEQCFFCSFDFYRSSWLIKFNKKILINSVCLLESAFSLQFYFLSSCLRNLPSSESSIYSAKRGEQGKLN